MSIYRAPFSIVGVNAVDAVLWNLKAGAADRARLLAAFFAISTAPTNAPSFGIKRMNAVGTGTITTTAPLLSDPADGASASSFETAWATTRPTVAGSSAVDGMVPLAIGNGFLFDFTNRPLIVPLSAGICGVNLIASGATVGAFRGWAEWED